MEHMLQANYALNLRSRILLDNREGFQDNEYLYFTISSNNREAIHLEQAALAYYLYENNYLHMAHPIPNNQGHWFTEVDQNKYIVVKVERYQDIKPTAHGIELANFHQLGTIYNYEPQEISSYGQWKDLWIQKLSMFESKVREDAKKYPNAYYRLVMDIIPYVIGISENAIQYVQESEKEARYDENDQGTIVFTRYRENLLEPVIWANELAFDHPTRDLAEYIRFKMLQKNERDYEDVIPFMEDYQMIRPLSVFSWRLLYARLLFPIQFFDLMGQGFEHPELANQDELLKELMAKQAVYEQRLSQLFKLLAVDFDALRIPVLHWL